MSEQQDSQSNASAPDAAPGVAVGGPPPGFSGATVGSFMQSQAPVHPMAVNQGIASPVTLAGANDPNIPVTAGNAHLLIGVANKANIPAGAVIPAANAPTATDAVVGGPGTENPSAGITRTAGVPESAAPAIRQVGTTVILPESNTEAETPEFEPGKPKPRTDPDADPHEVTSPGFQGFDRVNPLPPSVPPDGQIVHRGAVNEPHVVGVQSAGEPPLRVIGDQSEEARLIDEGKTPAEAQTLVQNPPPPEDAPLVPEETEDTLQTKKGKLPEDFPGRTALEVAGEATYAKVRKRIEAGTLQEIPGIADATESRIKEAMAE